ncbi:SusC/RagA family TonB-linked outer membrane protein [Olivibacter sitiensis]|uniref:SusC/RagA family TonB-linked outer membrane protein n=1 Tax=Olivibacter sitiensis TaxID=376470 RepID=UPI001FDFA3A1|nr:SusC/RagA family TonB-linked outer membrane protein [Olivibacter sitiensis]
MNQQTKSQMKRWKQGMLFFLLALTMCYPASVKSQEKKVEGIILGVDDTPLSGVSVLVKGTNKGVLTDQYGHFNLIGVETGATLIFKLLGFKGKEVLFDGQVSMKVILEEDLGNLDEVIVVGFGTQKKINVTGAIDQISGKELESRPVANIMQGLQGVSPGLNITYGNGAPGGIPNLNIRGTTSINGGSPLIVIDGIPVSDAWDMIRLNPSDIASYTVLRDAASAAIYGARATYGVILITTKTGTLGKQSISYNTNIAWGRPTELPRPVTDPYIFSRVLETATDNTPWDYVNFSDQHYQWAKERSEDPSLPDTRLDPNDPTRWAYMGNNDWYDYFFSQASFSQIHNLTFSGGARINEMPFSYYLSTDFTRENGLNKLTEDYWQRKGMRGRLSFSPIKWLKVDNNMNIYQTKRATPQASLTDIYYLQPIDVVKNPDGTWGNNSAGRLAARLVDGGEYGEDMFGFQNIANAVATLLNGDLIITGDASFKREYWRYSQNSKKYEIGYGPDDIREEGGNGFVSDRRGEIENDVFNLYGNYNKRFGKHAFGLTAGYNQESYIWSTTSAYRDQLISSSLPYLNLTTGEAQVGAQYSSYATRSIFGRLNYTLNERYILETTGRYDGSSRFPSTNRWGFFPSISGAWIASNEGFFERLQPALSTLKFRASYGSLGNQNVGDFSYIQTMGTGLSSYIIDGSQRQIITGAPPLTIDPNNYTWEKAATLNFGTDIGLFKDKFFFGFDYYIRETTGMLTAGEELPAVLGTGVPSQNSADLRTKGWELSFTYQDRYTLASKPLGFEAKIVLSDSRAHITKFKNDQRLLSSYFEGYEFGTLYGLIGDGFFASQAEIDALDQSAIVPWGALSIVPGWPKFQDLDGNGAIELGASENDMKDLTVIGNTSDRYRIGINLKGDWNGIDASIFLQGVLKRDFYPRHYLFWGPYQQPYANIYPWHLDYYRATGDSPEQREKHSAAYIAAGLADANLDPTYPVLQSWLADANYGSGLDIPNTQYLLNGAYLRIKNVTLGYTFPNNLTKRLRISRLRFFLTGENIFEFSSIKKYVDPETINSGSSAWAYPFQRKYAAGLNFEF